MMRMNRQVERREESLHEQVLKQLGENAKRTQKRIKHMEKPNQNQRTNLKIRTRN